MRAPKAASCLVPGKSAPLPSPTPAQAALRHLAAGPHPKLPGRWAAEGSIHGRPPPRRDCACSASSMLRSRQAVVLPLRPLWSVLVQEHRCRPQQQEAYRVGPGGDRRAGATARAAREPAWEGVSSRQHRCRCAAGCPGCPCRHQPARQPSCDEPVTDRRSGQGPCDLGLGRPRVPHPGAPWSPKTGGVGLTLWQLLGERRSCSPVGSAPAPLPASRTRLAAPNRASTRTDQAAPCWSRMTTPS
jgi:hypothetical protein